MAQHEMSPLLTTSGAVNRPPAQPNVTSRASVQPIASSTGGSPGATPNNPQSQPHRGPAVHSQAPPALPNSSPSSGGSQNNSTNLSNANANINNPASTPAPHYQRPVKSRQKPSVLTILEVISWPLITTTIFIFLACITYYANDTNWVLARIQPQHGILLLSLVSKCIDYGFDWGMKGVWEKWQRGRLLNARASLLTSLVMSSELWAWIKTLVFRHHTSISVNAPSSGKGGRLGYKLMMSPRFWSILRILFWVLIQFPGIIIMDPQTSYPPFKTNSTSGGVGSYDPNLAMQLESFPQLNNYILSIHQDLQLSTTVDAIEKGCADSRDCLSFLLTGGLMTLSPSPARDTSDPDMDYYVIKDIPGYQIESQVVESPSWENADCRLYGAETSPMQICMSTDLKQQIMLVGYSICLNGSSFDSCTAQTWAISLQLYQRTSTIVCDRSTYNVVNIDELGEAYLEDLATYNFTPAFDALLCPVGSNSSFCAANQPNALITDTIYYALEQYIDTVTTSGLPYDILRNLVATSVFLFNPVFMGALFNGPWPDTLQPGLPAENYFYASTARRIDYVAPQWWTVVAFIVSGGMLLLLMIIGLITSEPFNPLEGSDFGVVDFVRMRATEEAQGGATRDVQIGDVFGAKISDGEIMIEARNIRMRST